MQTLGPIVNRSNTLSVDRRRSRSIVGPSTMELVLGTDVGAVSRDPRLSL